MQSIKVLSRNNFLGKTLNTFWSRYYSKSAASSEILNAKKLSLSWVQSLNDFQSGAILKQHEQAANEPFAYRQRNSSYSIHRILTALQYWYKVPDENYQKIRVVLKDFQDALLLFDDIIDEAKIRRGEPTANVVFGTPLSISSVFYNFFRIQKELFHLVDNNPEVVEVWTDFFSLCYRGEAIDKAWTLNNYCPTEEEHTAVLVLKTGNYLRLCSKVMEHFINAKLDLERVSNVFGLYLQMVDDCESYFMPHEFYEGRENFASDLSEGKFTLPTIHAVWSMQNKEIEEMMKQQPSDVESKMKFVEILKEIGTKDYCRDILTELNNELRADIESVGSNPVMMRLLDGVRKF